MVYKIPPRGGGKPYLASGLYRDFLVKINGENNSEIMIFIFDVCKKRSFNEFSAKSLAQKV